MAYSLIYHSARIDQKNVSTLALVATREHILALGFVGLAHQIVAVIDEQLFGLIARHQAMKPSHAFE